jgi:hypothetical protein
MQHQGQLTLNELKKAMTVIEMLTNPNEQIWDFVYDHLLTETVNYTCRPNRKLIFVDDKDISPNEAIALMGPAKPIFKKPPPSMVCSFIMLTRPVKNYINVE